MSLFGRGRDGGGDDVGREYLRSAPPISRVDNLAIACAQRVAELDVSRPDRFGAPLTPDALRPASEVARDAMQQDRDLSAWTARKSAVMLRSVLEGGMAGSTADNLDTAFGAVGLSIGQRVSVVGGGSELSPEDHAAAAGLGGLCLSLFQVVGAPPSGWADQDRRFYVNLYTGEDGSDVEGLAYDLIAWMSVVLGRLTHRGLVDRRAPNLNPAFGSVPHLTRAGWYPNPPKFGDTSTGDAQLQRYWDGQWTDRARIRNGRDWREITAPLHDAPTD